MIDMIFKIIFVRNNKLILYIVIWNWSYTVDFIVKKKKERIKM